MVCIRRDSYAPGVWRRCAGIREREANARRIARLCAVGLSTRAMWSRPAVDAFRHTPSSVSCECRHRANAEASLATQSGSGRADASLAPARLVGDCEKPNPRSPSGVVVTGIPRPIAFTILVAMPVLLNSGAMNARRCAKCALTCAGAGAAIGFSAREHAHARNADLLVRQSTDEIELRRVR